MSERPAPAKLELLVRREDESFEVREVGSALGFIQSRPHRAPEGSFEISEVGSRVAGEPSFILKNAATERFLVLSEPETFLWEQMDGNTSLQEIATAYVLKYGEFDFDIIPNLIRKLQRAPRRSRAWRLASSGASRRWPSCARWTMSSRASGATR